jgi:hypothetical protein
VRLDWPDAVTFAKRDELPEPVVSGRFEAYLVPSIFFLQLLDGEEYHLPVPSGTTMPPARGNSMYSPDGGTAKV